MLIFPAGAGMLQGNGEYLILPQWLTQAKIIIFDINLIVIYLTLNSMEYKLTQYSV